MTVVEAEDGAVGEQLVQIGVGLSGIGCHGRSSGQLSAAGPPASAPSGCRDRPAQPPRRLARAGQRLHVLVHIPDAGVHARRGPPAAQPERDELAASVLAGEADLLVASLPSWLRRWIGRSRPPAPAVSRVNDRPRRPGPFKPLGCPARAAARAGQYQAARVITVDPCRALGPGSLLAGLSQPLPTPDGWPAGRPTTGGDWIDHLERTAPSPVTVSDRAAGAQHRPGASLFGARGPWPLPVGYAANQQAARDQPRYGAGCGTAARAAG